MRKAAIAAVLAIVAAPLVTRAQHAGGKAPASKPASLEAEIDKIRAIDNHGHYLKVVAPGEKPDDEYDALTFEEMEPAPSPVRLRIDNPEYVGAWKSLWGYRYADMAHAKEALEAKQKLMREKGDSYPAWVLDRLRIETALANRVAMGRGLTPPRFRWVSYVDALLFPISLSELRNENPDYRAFYTAEERLLERYYKEAGVPARPAQLSEYVRLVVVPTLERQKREGAVAVKFELAYLRSLDVGNPTEDEAERIYGRWHKGVGPSPEQYKPLQDYLFRVICKESGRLGLAVHIHSCGGAGSYYKLAGASPLLLEPLFNDEELRKTKFVLVHGGWPYNGEARVLLLKPNVYLDISAQTFLVYPRELAAILRGHLSTAPEKVLFGTDVEPMTPEVSWEETGWLTTTTARKALTIALDGMVADGDVSRERALDLARMVLRDNAKALYGF